MFSHLKIGQSELLKRKKVLWGHQVYVGALRLPDNSLLTVIARPLHPYSHVTLHKLEALFVILFC